MNWRRLVTGWRLAMILYWAAGTALLAVIGEWSSVAGSITGMVLAFPFCLWWITRRQKLNAETEPAGGPTSRVG